MGKRLVVCCDGTPQPTYCRAGVGTGRWGRARVECGVHSSHARHDDGTGGTSMGQGKTVLVVDDDPDVRSMVSLVLADEGYGVVEAGNGRDALEAVRRAAPDTILLDLQMPVMDGWAFVRECRADRRCDGVPIVVMSAGQRVGEAVKLGASDFLAKPFDLDVLLSKVASVL
ncbi:MAG: response regulator [Chloroflexota bacterium]|nr:response regulator [Chloroflexota bacterium]